MSHNLEVAKNLTGLFSERAPLDLSCLAEKEWQDIVSMAERHGLGPQLHLRLRELNRPGEAGPALSERLEKIYATGVARGARFSTELSALLNHFNHCSIPVIVLKGPHLAELVYRNWALRPMADFDLLVRMDDLVQAADALKALGYTSPIDVSRDAMVRKHYHLAQMTNARGSIVELHWKLQPPESSIKSDIDGIWKRAKHAVIADVDTLAMSEEDLLLYLCVHAVYHHRFSFGLLALRDIAMVLRSEGDRLDWDKLVGLSQQWRAERCLALALHLTRDFFRDDASVSDKIGRLCSADDLQVIGIATTRLMTLTDKGSPVSPDLAKYWGTRGFLKKIEILFSRIFPPTDIVAMIYSVDPGSKRLYLYYFKRLGYLIRRYGKTVFLLALSDHRALLKIQEQEQKDLLLHWLTAK